MNDFEEELQRHVEAHQAEKPDDLNAAAYQKVFKILSNEPRTSLPNSFADKVLAKVVARKKSEARRDLIWLSFGVVFLLTGLIVTAWVAGLTLELGFLKEMSGYTGVLTFATAVILAFNWIEKQLLPRST